MLTLSLVIHSRHFSQGVSGTQCQFRWQMGYPGLWSSGGVLFPRYLHPLSAGCRSWFPCYASKFQCWRPQTPIEGYGKLTVKPWKALEGPIVSRLHVEQSIGWVETYIQDGKLVNVTEDGKTTFPKFSELNVAPWFLTYTNMRGLFYCRKASMSCIRSYNRNT